MRHVRAHKVHVRIGDFGQGRKETPLVADCVHVAQPRLDDVRIFRGFEGLEGNSSLVTPSGDGLALEDLRPPIHEGNRTPFKQESVEGGPATVLRDVHCRQEVGVARFRDRTASKLHSNVNWAWIRGNRTGGTIPLLGTSAAKDRAATKLQRSGPRSGRRLAIVVLHLAHHLGLIRVHRDERIRYPLDGGRMYAAGLILKLKMDPMKAAFVTAMTAFVIASAMVGFGIVRIFTGGAGFSLYLALVGLYVLGESFELHKAVKNKDLKNHPIFGREIYKSGGGAATTSSSTGGDLTMAEVSAPADIPAEEGVMA